MELLEDISSFKMKYDEIVSIIDNIFFYYYCGYITLEEYYKIIDEYISNLNILKEKLLKFELDKENNEIINLINAIDHKVELVPKSYEQLELSTNLEKTKNIFKELLINPLCINNTEEIIKELNIGDKELELYLKNLLEADDELNNLRNQVFFKIELFNEKEKAKVIKNICNQIIKYREKILDKKFDSLMYFAGLLFTIGHLIVTEVYGIELVHPIISKMIPVFFSGLLISSLIQMNTYNGKIKKLEIEKKKMYD